MKNFLHFLLVLAVLILVLALAGCLHFPGIDTNDNAHRPKVAPTYTTLTNSP